VGNRRFYAGWFHTCSFLFALLVANLCSRFTFDVCNFVNTISELITVIHSIPGVQVFAAAATAQRASPDSGAASPRSRDRRVHCVHRRVHCVHRRVRCVGDRRVVGHSCCSELAEVFVRLGQEAELVFE